MVGEVKLCVYAGTFFMNGKQAKRLRRAAEAIAILGNSSQGAIQPKSIEKVHKEMKQLHKTLPRNQRNK